MICPACSADVDPIGLDIAPPLAICPSCEASIVTSPSLRRATADDTAAITDEQRAALVKLRKKTLADRRAYYAQHHAH